jgi:hypothetical protein
LLLFFISCFVIFSFPFVFLLPKAFEKPASRNDYESDDQLYFCAHRAPLIVSLAYAVIVVFKPAAISFHKLDAAGNDLQKRTVQGLHLDFLPERSSSALHAPFSRN